MAGKIVNEGKNRVLNQLFGSIDLDSVLYLGIYTSPTSEPTDNATLLSLTEPSGFNYSRIALNRGSYTIVDNQAIYPQQIFEAIGAWGNCWGYFVCNVSSGTAGILSYVEQFSDGPYNVQDGERIKVTCHIKIQ